MLFSLTEEMTDDCVSTILKEIHRMVDNTQINPKLYIK